MKGKVTLGGVIAFLRIYLALSCCWPLSMNATKFQKLRRKVFRSFCLAHCVTILIVQMWTLSKSNDDLILVLKVGCEVSAFLQVVMQLMIFALQSERFQSVVSEMEAYYQRAPKYEMEIFQQYVDKCKVIYGGILCCILTTGTMLVISPVFLPQSLPLDAEYPFDVKHQPLKAIIFAHHILAVYQSVSQVSANIFAAFLLWFVAARFEILSARFRTVTNMKQLIECIYEHYALLRYAKEVTYAIRFVALLCVTFSTGAVIFGCLIVTTNQAWVVKSMFVMIGFCGFMELYMYAWPADNVINTSSDIAAAAYDSLWYNNDPAMQKILIYVILRSQHPVTISIPCAMPTLSMNYYATYISTVFSYMTLIRIILDK